MSSGPNSAIGLLVADDSSAICRLIVQLLSSERSIHFVGIASTLEDTLHLAAAYTPDVLLLDLHLDDLLPQNPLAVKIGLLSCVRHIVAMSTRCDEQERQLAQRYGAVALVDKFFLAERLAPAILGCCSTKKSLLSARRHPNANRPVS